MRSLLVALIAVSVAASAEAHHEAIFGPQSSAVLSPDRFFSAQIFTREVGQGEDTTRETTAVFSGGLQPFRRPLSIAFVVPVSFVGSSPAAASRRGFEDAVVSARYKADVAPLADAFGLDESYVMGVGGVELPTGTLDHEFGRGGVGGVAAGLVNIERRPFSAIGYAYYHYAGAHRGSRQSGNVFVGGGAGWTPIDNLQTGRLLSMQLGLSHERTFAEEENGLPLPDSGGSGLFLHQGVVLGAGHHLQLFALVSLPLTQEWRAPDDRQRFRLGAGTIFIFN